MRISQKKLKKQIVKVRECSDDMAVGSSSPVLTADDVGALPTQRPRSISLMETQVLCVCVCV